MGKSTISMAMFNSYVKLPLAKITIIPIGRSVFPLYIFLLKFKVYPGLVSQAIAEIIVSHDINPITINYPKNNQVIMKFVGYTIFLNLMLFSIVYNLKPF